MTLLKCNSLDRYRSFPPQPGIVVDIRSTNLLIHPGIPPQKSTGLLLPTVQAPLGGIVAKTPAQWPREPEWEAARIDDQGRPLPAPHEKVLGRWLSGRPDDKSADCQVSGSWTRGDSVDQGPVAVGPLYVLLTRDRLRCAMPAEATLVRRSTAAGRLDVLSEGPYAFSIELAELDRFDGGRHGVGVASRVEAVIMPCAVPVGADWQLPDHFDADTSDCAAAVLRALVTLKSLHPDPIHRAVAGRLALVDAAWLVGDEPFHVEF